MLRVFDAAVAARRDAVCGFVGRNQRRSMDQNLADFEESVRAASAEAKARGLTYRVEQCPMPGWTTGDNFHNNIAYTPGTWIALHRICERHGVGDQFRIHYDPSHAILMGQDTRSIFQYLKDAGYAFLIGGFHVKGQVIDARASRRGATADRPSSAATGSAASRRRDRRTRPTRGRSRRAVRARVARHGAARSARLPAEPQVDWLDHQLAARELLALDVANTPLVVEHEFPKARLQDRDASEADPAGSIAFVRRIDERRRACMRLQHEVLPAQGIPIQGVGRQAYRS